MQFLTTFLLLCSTPIVLAQQYAGDVISGNLPTTANAEVAFFKIDDPSGKNNNLTLINYYSHGTDGSRIVESKIQRAVIVLHGLLRDPWNYENDMLNALAMVQDTNVNRDSVAVMAPYFPNGNDKNLGYPWTDGLKAGQGSTSNAMVWSGSKWSAGANNQYPHNSRNTSSYYILDELVRYFDDKTLFPNMKQIVLAGHSLGGQMLQRYAAVGDKLDTESPVVLWIANGDSWAWLSDYRPLNIPDCPTYNDYREGFAQFVEYGMTYGANLVAQGLDAIKANFDSKQIAWARALQDFGDHASSCAPQTTGQDRNERFFFFMKWFQPSCPDPSGTNCDTVDLVDAPHDNGQMFHSAAGLARLFTDNFYGDNSRAYDFGYPRKQQGDDPFPDPSLVNTPGTSNYNTYAGGLTYQGCWTDQAPTTAQALSTLLYDNSNNTIEACTSGCADSGYKVAGMSDATKCWCGNEVSSASAILTVDMQCKSPCPGNTAQICGGIQRLSLFSSGYPTFV
ncbi:WSC-domain-containing protein [Aureobasidium pullulans]|uniref:WSC-domain-containing protein n=1 Tax=Aureobasidium pullulans TaxID=5580 RepID=A0A4S8Y2J9_AURPU|nr:WSC-domain-containing protein [Aureobasidium pullulans]